MITKEAQNKDIYTKNIHFLSSARNSFEFILRNVLKENDIILMPSYIGETTKEGSGVFDPVRHANIKYMFYKLNYKLFADFEDIKQKIENNKNIKAILLIHYFGFPQESILEIKKLCDIHNIFLIEDCAHCLESKYKNLLLGTIGDFSFNSIHKLIATPDGGILKINNPDYFYLIPKNNLIDYNTLIQFINTDIRKTSRKRIENYKYYLKKLPTQSKLYTVMYNELPKDTVPLNFPILVKNFDRYKFYNILIDKKVITVSLYYQLIKELDINEYPTSFKISKEILNLPVHQDIDFSDIDFIISKIQEIENEFKI